MNRIIFSIMIGILITSSFSMATLSEDNESITQQNLHIVFETPQIKHQYTDYLTIEMQGTNGYTVEPGSPQLPVSISTFELPKQVKISDVSCDLDYTYHQDLSLKIQPVPKAEPLSKQQNKIRLIENTDIYDTSNIFPEKHFEYVIRCGLNNEGIQTTFVTIIAAPIHYFPQDQTIQYSKEMDVTVTYTQQQTNKVTAGKDTRSMVIIAPEEFSSALQPLITHKNSYGLSTTLKTTESIYSEFQGRDKPEQIKQFIKHTKEQDNTTYILLMGGLTSMINAKDRDDANQGSTDWYVPVRYTNNRGYDSDPSGTTSDLYYADLYKYDEETGNWVFEDWDSNGNNIFAEYTFFGKDDLDLVPDIYVGRLACRSIDEVNVVVQKIIDYESNSPADKPWMNTMVGVGGRTFSFEEGIPDGEYCCNSAFTHMNTQVDEEIRIYASNKDTGGLIPNAEAITSTLTQGAGFVFFSGHGSPMAWNTNWPVIESGEDHNWTGGYRLHDFFNIKNNEKLPIIIIGGCHNGMFNISVIPALLAHYIDHNEERYWVGGYPTPECMSWRLVAKPDGGAIASTGCTGYGFGGNGAISRSSALEDNLFYLIGQQGITHLGDAHSQAISKYIAENNVRKIEIHCIACWQFFGDPSLYIGGYP